MFYGHDDLMGIEGFVAGMSGPACPPPPVTALAGSCQQIPVSYAQKLSVPAGCKVCPPSYTFAPSANPTASVFGVCQPSNPAACQQQAQKIKAECPASANPLLIGGECYYPQGMPTASQADNPCDNLIFSGGPVVANSANGLPGSGSWYCTGPVTGDGDKPAPKPAPTPGPPVVECCKGTILYSSEYDNMRPAVVKTKYGVVQITDAVWQSLVQTLLSIKAKTKACALSAADKSIIESIEKDFSEALAPGSFKAFENFWAPVLTVNENDYNAVAAYVKGSYFKKFMLGMYDKIVKNKKNPTQAEAIPAGLLTVYDSFIASGAFSDTFDINISKVTDQSALMTGVSEFKKYVKAMIDITPHLTTALKLPTTAKCSSQIAQQPDLKGLGDLSTNKKVLLFGALGLAAWWLLKKNKVLALCFTALLCASGCVGDQANRQQVNQPPIILPAPVMQTPEVTKADLNQLRSETVASNNAAQQSQTGAVNLAVAKVAEKMTGIEGDVSGVKAAFTTSMQAVTSAVADFKATLTANATAIANIKADLKAEFDAKITAQADLHATAVAALKSEITDMRQTLSAGRDVNQTQFTKDMAATLQESYKTMLAESHQSFWCIIAICHIWAGVVIAILHGSVKHERKKTDIAVKSLKEANDVQRSG